MIAFNYRLVPENMPDDIFITDTTFRDDNNPEPHILQGRWFIFINCIKNGATWT